MNALILSLLLTFTAIYLWRGNIYSSFTAAITALFTFVSLLLSLIYYVADSLSGAGINEAVIYHLSADLSGAGFSDFKEIICLTICCFIAICIISIAVFKKVKATRAADVRSRRTGCAFLVILLALWVNPAASDIYSVVNHPMMNAVVDSAQETLQPKQYLVPNKFSFKRKKNIIYLYLESVERTYMDEKLFPDLLPNLKALEQSAVSFTDINQVRGAGWTMGGMVASQCGIPLFTAGGGNSMFGMDYFLPGATAIGDILHKQGYTLNYLGGARLEFAGKGKFYSSHGFDKVEGFKELRHHLENPDYKSVWGLHDDSLFALAKKRYDHLSSSGEPFGLFLLTLDTHHPRGFIPRCCKSVSYADGGNPILNALHCADKVVANFIRYVINSEGFSNTTLIVLSDHLSLPNTAYDILQKGKRRDLLMIFDKGLKPQKIPKSGSTLDVAPTVLNILGANLTGLGFGRDLLASTPTLHTSTAALNDILIQSRTFLSTLWSYPQLDDGITAEIDKHELKMGDRIVRFPALFVLKDKKVESIRFEFNTPTPLVKQVAKLNYNQPFIWVDKGSAIRSLFPRTAYSEEKYGCLIGALGSNTSQFFPLENGFHLAADKLALIIYGQNICAENKIARQEDLENIRRYGTVNVEKYHLSDHYDGHYIIKSAGGLHAGASMIKNIATGREMKFVRGLTLVGLNPGHSLVKLAHVDSCGGSVTDTLGLDSDFHTIIDENSNRFGAFAIVVHDSARGEINYDFASLFKGTGLRRWDEIRLRKPYIGVISNTGKTMEYLATAEALLVLDISGFVPPLATNEQ